MTNQTNTALYDAVEYCFIVAELDPGRFYVLFRTGKNQPFERIHNSSIRREGAEALAADYARIAGEAMVNLRDPDVSEKDRRSFEDELCMLECFGENQALIHDAAQAILPFIGDDDKAKETAMSIAAARPWEMPGRDRPADPPYEAAADDDQIPF